MKDSRINCLLSTLVDILCLDVFRGRYLRLPFLGTPFIVILETPQSRGLQDARSHMVCL